MAYTTPTAPTTASGAKLNSTGDIITPWQALVDENELRDGDAWVDGVTSGGVCTSSGTTVTMPTTRAYVAGKRYGGADTVDMTGKSANTYYGYLDSADDTTPLKVKTTAPTAGELLLFSLVWSGTAITSINTNVLVKGIVKCPTTVYFPGTVTTSSKAVIPVIDNWWVEDVQLVCVDNGTGTQATTAEVSLGANGAAGTTIFTTPGNRPTIWSTTADYTLVVSGEPDGDRNPDDGEHLTVSFGTTDAAANVSVTINMRLR